MGLTTPVFCDLGVLMGLTTPVLCDLGGLFGAFGVLLGCFWGAFGAGWFEGSHRALAWRQVFGESGAQVV